MPRICLNVRFILRLVRFAPMLVALALSGCATLPDFGSSDTAAGSDAEQLYRQGDLEHASQAFLDLAEHSRGDAASHYRLRAGEVLRDAGNLAAAEIALNGIKRRRLSGDESLRLDLLDAEIALKRGDAGSALEFVNIADADLPPALRLRVLELRARAQLASRSPLASAQTRATLDRLLEANDREQNRKQIIDALAAIDGPSLRDKAAALASNDPVLPWIEQSLRTRGIALPHEIPQANRQVGTVSNDANGATRIEGYSAPHQVALLLPLSGTLSYVAQSIRDGFFTARSGDTAEKAPDVRIYDSGSTPAEAIAAYHKAVAEGADHVVGPLQREAVGELFHQHLAARVLALNHPDTGEVPPPGNAEFGLVPDAEGAQVAQHMLERGIHTAAIIAADTDWAQRAAVAFRTQFEANGGQVSGETRLSESMVNYHTAITQATASLGETDSGIFISMRPQQARLLLPQLKLANVNAPVFATSHIYGGERNPGLDRDLDTVEFCDAPWLFGNVPGRPDIEMIAGQIASANGVGARLFAFGMDAYALLPYLGWMLEHPDHYVDGATGQLTADSFGRIHRLLTWARFENGIARPVQGALHAMSEQAQTIESPPQQ
ncbi:MAG: penicillin-binding protein activator [Dokdonella sp.]